MPSPKNTRICLWLLTLLCLGQMIYIYASNRTLPDPDEIISVSRVGENGAIYEVRYSGGGATVPHVYRYFVMEVQPSHEAALQRSKDSVPFLVTRSTGAVHEITRRSVKLRTLNKIYEFHNTAYYKVEGNLNEVKFELEARMP